MFRNEESPLVIGSPCLKVSELGDPALGEVNVGDVRHAGAGTPPCFSST